MTIQHAKECRDAVRLAQVEYVWKKCKKASRLQAEVQCARIVKVLSLAGMECPDGCGRTFEECPLHTEDTTQKLWIEEVLARLRSNIVEEPVNNGAICNSCFLTISKPGDIGPGSCIAIPHNISCDKYPINILGPAIILLQESVVRRVVGFRIDANLPTPEQASGFLADSSTGPPMWCLLIMLDYFLRPWNTSSPLCSPTIMNLARSSQPSDLDLPPSQEDVHFCVSMDHIAEMALARTSLAQVAKMPKSGRTESTETYEDNSKVTVVVQWTRNPAISLAPDSQSPPWAHLVFKATVDKVLEYIDKMDEPGIRLLCRVILNNSMASHWCCHCGCGQYPLDCPVVGDVSSLRPLFEKGMKKIGDVIRGDSSLAKHMCSECLMPELHDSDGPSATAHIGCTDFAFDLVSPPLLRLLRTCVCVAFGTNKEAALGDMAPLLSSEWAGHAPFLKFHRLFLLHHFMWPFTKHSPLSTTSSTGHSVSIGPSEANIIYLEDLAATRLSVVAESIRPRVKSVRTSTRTDSLGAKTVIVDEYTV